MSHISVRPTTQRVLLASAFVALVGGVAMTPQPAQSQQTVQSQQVAQQGETSKQFQSETQGVKLPEVECSPSNDGDGFSQALARLVHRIDPALPPEEMTDLVAEPHGKLYVYARADNPQGPNEPLNKADTLCVTKTYTNSSYSGSSQLAWSVKYQGYPTRTASR